jgi:hypothetical protein
VVRSGKKLGKTAETASGAPFDEPLPNGRDSRGRFTRGNRGALKSGQYSRAIATAELPEQSEVRAILAEREAAIVTDLGGREALSTMQVDLVRDYQTLHCIASYLESRIVREGPITAKGRTRAAVAVLLSIVDRKMRVAQLLGITRAARPVESLAEAIARVTQHHVTEDGAVGSDVHEGQPS